MKVISLLKDSERKYTMQRFNQSALFTPLLSLPVMAGSAPIVDVNYKVINSGVVGNNSLDLLARIGKDCLVHQLDLTVLMTGTNDMNSRLLFMISSFSKNFR